MRCQCMVGHDGRSAAEAASQRRRPSARRGPSPTRAGPNPEERLATSTESSCYEGCWAGGVALLLRCCELPEQKELPPLWQRESEQPGDSTRRVEVRRLRYFQLGGRPGRENSLPQLRAQQDGGAEQKQWRWGCSWQLDWSTGWLWSATTSWLVLGRHEQQSKGDRSERLGGSCEEGRGFRGSRGSSDERGWRSEEAGCGLSTTGRQTRQPACNCTQAGSLIGASLVWHAR